MDYILKDSDELIMTGKQLREFKEIIIKETKSNGGKTNGT